MWVVAQALCELCKTLEFSVTRVLLELNGLSYIVLVYENRSRVICCTIELKS